MRPDLHGLLDRLADGADGIERSFSITADGTERRILFFFAISDGSVQRLADAAAALALPRALVAAWRSALPTADAIGLAIRDDLASVRLYTQHWQALAGRVQAGDTTPAPLYAGFKALPGGRTRIDSYVCWPGAPRSEFMPEIETGLSDQGADPAAVRRAFAPLSAARCIFTRTRSGARNSWLATLRRAPMSRTDVAAALAPVLAGTPAGAEIAAAAAGRDMIHIAGGTDSVKGRFLTLYFQAGPQDVKAAITPGQGGNSHRREAPDRG